MTSPDPAPRTGDTAAAPSIDRVDFAAILASRLCHDLLSPIGAFANGLELLADERDEDMRRRCLDLLEQSAQASAGKLKFFRLAFGSAGGFGDMVPAADVRDAITGILSTTRPVTLGWMPTDAVLPKPVVRIILNLALTLADALVRGGRLDIGCETTGTRHEIALRAEGERLILDPEIERMLNDGPDRVAMTSRTAPAALVHAIATAASGQVMVAREGPAAMLVGAVIEQG